MNSTSCNMMQQRRHDWRRKQKTPPQSRKQVRRRKPRSKSRGRAKRKTKRRVSKLPKLPKLPQNRVQPPRPVRVATRQRDPAKSLPQQSPELQARSWSQPHHLVATKSDTPKSRRRQVDQHTIRVDFVLDLATMTGYPTLTRSQRKAAHIRTAHLGGHERESESESRTARECA